MRAEFLSNFAALGRLQAAIKAALQERPYLIGLDGRLLHVRSDHAALNTLLQSAGALLMKKACVLQHHALRHEHKLTYPRDYAQVASVHDEKQFSVLPKYAELVGKSGPAALKAAGQFFDFKCRLDGEYKIGRNWAETH
jgi:DNA polymerase I-like protein with 3'-5' exonuclease and polymerase domains